MDDAEEPPKGILTANSSLASPPKEFLLQIQSLILSNMSYSSHAFFPGHGGLRIADRPEEIYYKKKRWDKVGMGVPPREAKSGSSLLKHFFPFLFCSTKVRKTLWISVTVMSYKPNKCIPHVVPHDCRSAYVLMQGMWREGLWLRGSARRETCSCNQVKWCRARTWSTEGKCCGLGVDAIRPIQGG